MTLFKNTAGCLCALAVLLSINFANSQDLYTKSNAYGANNRCNIIFSQMQSAYSSSNIEAKMVVAGSNNIGMYLLKHSFKDYKRYSLWESLDGERYGYALRNGDGFDYNIDRRFMGHLTWHPTQIWNRVFNLNNKFKSFSCVMTGRTRLAGYGVTLIRLVPQDGLRYTYLIARDDESNLPIELAILGPDGNIVSKITAMVFKDSNSDFPYSNDVFNAYLKKHTKLDKSLKPWSELKIPAYFSLVSSGALKDENGSEMSIYQEFSDGLTSFRVYKSPRISVLMPSVSSGTMTVYRKTHGGSEYAVVGEVSMHLCESVLSNLVP